MDVLILTLLYNNLVKKMFVERMVAGAS